MSSQIDLARRWIAARNARDLDALVDLSSPEIEMHLARGVLRGADGLREWVERMSFGVAPYVELERFWERETRLVAALRGQLRFVDAGQPAGDWEEGAAAFEFTDGHVLRFEPGPDLDRVLDATGLTADDAVDLTS